MKRWRTRWGWAALRRESPPVRRRQGHRLGNQSKLVLLVPAHSPLQRMQLMALVEWLKQERQVGAWTLIADTGTTRKAHAKSRARRIKSIDSGQAPPPDFPQEAQVQLMWRDDLSFRGLPASLPPALKQGEVLLSLDAKSEYLPIQALLKRSPIGFRVGPVEAGEPSLDFMMPWKEGTSMLEFVQMTFHYLKSLDLK